MKSNSQIRKEARKRLHGSWAVLALIALIAFIIGGSLNIPMTIQTLDNPFNVPQFARLSSNANLLVSIFVLPPIFYGVYLGMLKLFRGEKERITFDDAFSVFKDGRYLKAVALNLIVSIFTFLWALLLLIPAFIKMCSYAMAPFILLDNPEMGIMDAIDESREMMKGHKWQFFLQYLGLFGLVILSVFTLGIALFWIVPYFSGIQTNFYESLRIERDAKGGYLEPEI